MTVSINVSTVWKSVTNLYVKVGTTGGPFSTGWRTITDGYVKVGTTGGPFSTGWRSFFASTLTPSIASTVTISRNNAAYPSTLTGTNFSWTNSTSLTYVFQKSSDNSSWSNIGSATSIANPSSGSSNTVTYALTVSDFPAFASYFRFVVTAVNSTYSTSASSQSSSVIVYYGTPTPISPFPSITGSTTVGNTAYGNIGTWSYSPTSYDYRWFFMSGATSYPLTFSQARSVSNKTLSGFLAVLTTSADHGYKASDIIAVTSMDSLFNKSNATIISVTSNTIVYTVDTPTAWANAGTAYSSGTFVSLSGNAYAAASTISSVSAYSSVFIYSTGAIVYSGNNRYQSNLNSNTNHPVTDVIWWNNLGSYAPGGSQWTLQSFSNTATSGTTTGPNYYEGTVSSSTSISLTVPTTDYRSGLNMISKALYFGVKAYNLATPSPSEYSNYKLVYGVPVITLGTPTYPSGTQAQIPFTHVYMTKYSIDVVRAGASHTGYPTIITSSTSPITISGLTGGLTYTVNVYPINGEDTYGSLKTTSITPPAAPSPPTITSSSSTTTSITLNFTLGANSTSTRAYLNSGFDGSTSGTSYTFSSLAAPGTAYTLALYGYDGTTLSTTSSGGSYSTSTGAALTPTFGANTSTATGFTGSVTNYDSAYNWNTPSNGSFTLTNGTWTWGIASGSTWPFTVTGLSASQSSTATVTTTRTGYTSGSASTTGTASAALFAPSAPSPSVTSGPTQATATVSWSAPSNGGSAITSYEAQLGSYGYSNIGNVLSSSISGLNASTSYTYYVRAINAIGTSPAGSVSFTTLAAPVPSGGTVSLSPSGSQYEGVTLTASTTSWSGTPSSYSVRIYASTSNPPTTGSVLKATSISGASSVTYPITTLDASAPAYYFKAFATATNSGGTSTEEPGSNVVLSVAKTVPSIVTSFTATSSLSGTTLSWNATWSAPSSNGGATITSYKVFVERGPSISGPWSAATTSISTTAGGTYSGAYTAISPYSTVNATTPKTIYGRVTSTTSTWIRVYVAAVNSVGTGSTNTAIG